MNVLYRIGARTVFILLLGLGLAACGDQQELAQSLDPVAFHVSDECHVCGMVLGDFPGPKGQAVEKSGVKKFCSTAEMLGWWLQPENRQRSARLYVHDMGRSDWEQPDDSHLIDAASAFYVIGTSLKVSMGVPLATFATSRPPGVLLRRTAAGCCAWRRSISGYCRKRRACSTRTPMSMRMSMHSVPEHPAGQ